MCFYYDVDVFFVHILGTTCFFTGIELQHVAQFVESNRPKID